jgi:4-hydroxybenzoate polyprenyltransferase
MVVSPGWYALVGGFAGAVKFATGTKFTNRDFDTDKDRMNPLEDHDAEVKVSPLARWLLVALCVATAIFGAIKIQQADNWNPFQPVPPAAGSAVTP